jgi:hypothetical protein
MQAVDNAAADATPPDGLAVALGAEGGLAVPPGALAAIVAPTGTVLHPVVDQVVWVTIPMSIDQQVMIQKVLFLMPWSKTSG